METEFVDADEFAAIELAMAQANAISSRPSTNIMSTSARNQVDVLTPSQTPDRNQSGPSNSRNVTAFLPNGASGTLNNGAHSSNRNHNLNNSAPNSNHAQQQRAHNKGTLDYYVVANNGSNMAANQNARSPCQPLSQTNQQQPANSATARNAQAVVVTFRVLEGGRRFGAQCPYNPAVIDAFKSCRDRVYDHPTKTWQFGIGTHSELLHKLQSIGNVAVKPLAPHTLKNMENVAREEERAVQNVDVQAELSKLPLDLQEALMPFQREGVEFAVRHQGRCLIGDEMGLGKTIQAIAIAKIYEAEWPLLVVVPSIMRMVWKGEVLKWLGDLEEEDIALIMTGKDSIGRKVTIISYDLVLKFENDIKNRNYKVVICDESHFLKSHSAKRTKAIVPIVKKAKRAVLLTGTPALSRPAELYNQVVSLRASLFPAWNQFARTFCDARDGPFGLQATGASHLDELRLLLKQVMIRRLKDEVLSQLPAKRRQQVYVQVDKLAYKDFKKRTEKMRVLLAKAESFALGQEERDAAKVEQRQMLNELYKDTGVAKLKAVDEYISDMIHTGYKFLVFAHHLDVLDGIEATVKNNKVRYIRIDGSTPQAQRSNLVDLFQNDEHVQVAVLSVTAAGQGLTLTAGSAVVFAELHWTPGILVQAEDRAHRIGQQYSVNVHFLLAKGTADDIMWPVIEKKINVVGNTLDGQYVGGLSGDSRTIEDLSQDTTQTQIDSFMSQIQQQPSSTAARSQAGYGRARQEAWEVLEDDEDDELDEHRRGRHPCRPPPASQLVSEACAAPRSGAGSSGRGRDEGGGDEQAQGESHSDALACSAGGSAVRGREGSVEAAAGPPKRRRRIVVESDDED